MAESTQRPPGSTTSATHSAIFPALRNVIAHHSCARPCHHGHSNVNTEQSLFQRPLLPPRSG